MKRFLKVITLTLALATLPMFAFAATTGSAAVNEGQTYTLEQMLTYAMQDEYMAEAEYQAIRTAFGVNNPYANIMNAEQTHQDLLLPLFGTYGVAVPANTAAGSVVIPATLQETYEIGVQAEINNIAMYQAFLAQNNVPQDVRAAFEDLMKASESHLAAFSRNAEKTGTGLGNGAENGRNSNQSEDLTAGFGQGNGNYTVNQTAAYGQGNGYYAADQTVSTGRGGRNQTANLTTGYGSADQGRGFSQSNDTRTASRSTGGRGMTSDVQTRGMGTRDSAGYNADNCDDDCEFCDSDQTQETRGGRWN